MPPAPPSGSAPEAWGSDANLFTRGMAEVVTDPALTEAPLAEPGKVIKRARGTAAEHLAALPKSSKEPARRSTTGGKVKSAEPASRAKPVKPVKPKPKPSRRSLDAAEKAIERADEKYRSAADAIRDREEALRRERHDLNTRREADLAKLQTKLDDAREVYDRAVDAWRDE
jgi:hypothetical protein